MTLIWKMVRYSMVCLTVFMSIWIVASAVQNIIFYHHDLFENSVAGPIPFFAAFWAILGWIFSLWAQKFMRRGKVIVLRNAMIAIVVIILMIAILGFLEYWLRHSDFGVYLNLNVISTIATPCFMSGYFLGLGTFLYEHLNTL